MGEKGGRPAKGHGRSLSHDADIMRQTRAALIPNPILRGGDEAGYGERQRTRLSQNRIGTWLSCETDGTSPQRGDYLAVARAVVARDCSCQAGR